MNYPKHIGLIPDGNRTWAKEKWLTSFKWHLEWFNKVKQIAKYIFSSTPIEVFTVWWLSTENFKKRSKEELNYLFELYKQIPWNLYKFMKKNKINFKVSWNESKLPMHLISFLKEKEKELKFEDSNKYMVLALNYGWQDEIIRWIKKIVNKKEEITQANLEKYLDFWWLPKLDLVIRTKQKLAKRLSWFMLWWIWYAQLYFTDLYCPQLTINEFIKALEWYNSSQKTQNYWK